MNNKVILSRKKKLLLNTITSLIKEFVVVICGFILPRYILKYYGSATNGLLTSITQFLGFITFLEMGIGPVIQSNLYKPLAEKNEEEISKIIVSSEKFFRRIAYIFIVYVVILFFVFPALKSSQDFWFTGSLILIISISTFAQYFFGITYQLLLNADQKAYIQTSMQIIVVILNTVISVVLMISGCSIQIVKLASSLIFVIRPLGQMLYVKHHYKLNKRIKYNGEPIKQKWNGFAQHLAAVVVANTDVVLLTLFSTLENVSIYSVYFLVVNGVTNAVMTLDSGISSFWGNMIANNEKDKLNRSFTLLECFTHLGCTLLFIITGLLIVPFITVYTNGIHDVDYSKPLFGLLLVVAYGIRVIRLPYFNAIKAAGHYKQTQKGSFIQVVINIVISIALVIKFDLNGVAVGTLFAMLYHTTYLAWYLRKNILNYRFKMYIGHLIVDVICAVLCWFATKWIVLENITYVAWFVMALKVGLVCCLITIVINLGVYKKTFYNIKELVIRK